MPELGYTFISDYTILNANSNLMSRAVRVKVSVKDKLERIYNKVSLVKNEPVAEVKKEEPVEVKKVVSFDELVDNSKEALDSLNEKLNALHNQKNTLSTDAKAVLFTKPLVEKISNMSGKWMKIEDAKKEFVIPGEWDKVTTEDVKTETVNNEVVSTPVVENIQTQEVTAPETPIMSAVNAEIDNNVVSNTLTPIPSEIANSFDEGISNIAIPNFEVNTIGAKETLISEPAPVAEEVKPEVVNEVKEESSKQVSIEDKIAELLNRKNEIHKEEKVEPQKVEVEVNSEVKDKKLVEPTQTIIMAKLQKLNNSMKEKTIENANLKTKVDTLTESLAEAKNKNANIMDTIQILTIKNRELAQENERITNNSSKVEHDLNEKVSNLESQLSTSKDSFEQKQEETNRIIAELKAKHAEEIEKLKNEKDKEILDITAKKDKQIQAIYSTIADALGENMDLSEDNSKALAA